MKIKDQLLLEHSLKNTMLIVEYASLSETNFAELMQCFLSIDNRVAQRAASAVSLTVTKKTVFINQYLPLLVQQLTRKDVHAAVIRNSIRILQQIDIPKELHGEVMNACFSFIEKHETPVAIKAFSITVLHNLSKYYPELLSELKLIIEERWEVETAAFKSRAKKILEIKR